MTATVAQAAHRALEIHAAVLTNLEAGGPAFTTDVAGIGDLRGRSTALATLRRWEAIDNAGRITPKGTAILAELRRRGKAR